MGLTTCPPPVKVVDVGAHVVTVVKLSCRPRVAGVSVRHGELWFRGVRLTQRLPSRGGLRRYPDPVAASPDGRFVAWRVATDSASVTADGLPLYVTRLARGGATRPLTQAALAYRDYAAWCGGRLVFVDGGLREAMWPDKRLVVASPPDWRPRPLWNAPGRAFGSIACAPGGRWLAVLSQPASRDSAFFSTRWQLWRVGLDGTHRLLDRPPPGWADESPRFTGDGALFFVRERNGRGTVRSIGGGPVVSLGYSLGYYGHHDLPYRVR